MRFTIVKADSVYTQEELKEIETAALNKLCQVKTKLF